MENNLLYNELYCQLKETCRAYGVKINPEMTYLDAWSELVEKLDPSTKRLLMMCLKEDVENNRGIIFEEMLALLNEHNRTYGNSDSITVKSSQYNRLSAVDA